MKIRKKHRLPKKTLFFLLNVGVLLFLLVAFGREYVGNRQIEQEIQALEEQRAQLEQEKLHTLSLIDELSSEYYLEKEGRLKYGLGKEGEELIVVQEGEVPDGQQAQREGSGAFEDFGTAKRWFYYFFNKAKYERLSAL